MKFKKICGIISVLSVLLFVCILKYNFTFSKRVKVEVDEIKVRDISELQTPIEKMFEYYGWEESIKNVVIENRADYVFAEISYKVSSLFDTQEMYNLEFYVKSDKSDEDFILAYNENNGNHFINCAPNSNSGMSQTLIIKRNGKTSDEIYKMLLGQEIKMTYHTQYPITKIGNGYLGTGKHSYKFKIGEHLS